MTQTPPANSFDEARTAAQRDPRNAAALLVEAEGLLGTGDRVGAARLAEEAFAVDPSSFRTARTLSGILDACGRRPEAIEVGLRAIALDGFDSEAKLHLGGLLLAERKWRDGAEYLAAHVSGPGATARGWRLLSTALHQTGHTERGLDAVSNAIALDANDIEYRLHRASLLGVRGRWGDSLEELASAEAIAPLDARIPRAASGVLEALGDGEGAYREATKACGLSPGDTVLAAHRDQLLRAAGVLQSDVTQDMTGVWTARKRSPRSRPRRAEPSLFELVMRRWRVIHAVMMREMRTRFGRSRIGYGWALMEPLTHLLTLGSVFSLFNHSPPPVGDSLFLYYLTGLLPYLMFAHVTSEVGGALAANGSVLQLPSVRRTDVIAARAVLHLATEIIVGVVAFSISALLDEQGLPANFMNVIFAVLCLWFIAIGVGAINMVISEFLPSWDTIYASIVRLLYFSSGIYYSPMAMPDWIRDMLAWNPILQGVEAFRAGFYAGYEPHWLDRTYLAWWAIGTLTIGLCLERSMRRIIRVRA